jgi:hypothetical protein
LEKVIRDGQVAVIYSPGFGAGWYTWNRENPEIIFDPNIVHYVELEEWDKLQVYIELKYPDVYSSAASNLTIKWIDQGAEFKIDEYDGNESIILKEKESWLVA